MFEQVILLLIHPFKLSYVSTFQGKSVMLHLCEGPVLGHIINTLRVFPLYITAKIESGNKAQHRIGFKPVTSRSYGMYSTTVAPKHLLNSTGTYLHPDKDLRNICRRSNLGPEKFGCGTIIETNGNAFLSNGRSPPSRSTF